VTTEFRESEAQRLLDMLHTELNVFIACCDSSISTFIKSRLPSSSQHRIAETPQGAIDCAQQWGCENAVVHIWALECRPEGVRRLSGLKVKSNAQLSLILRGDSNIDGTPRVSLGQVQFKGPQPYLLVSLFFARQDLFNKQQQYSQAAMKHDLLLFSTGLPNKTNLADPCEAYQYILMHYSQAALNQSVLCFSMPSVWCTLYTHLKQRRPFEHIASLAFCVAAIH